jgi:hypothetical protein
MEAQTKAPARVSGGNGRGRIRTFEGISHQIYSLTPLATWVHARSTSFAVVILPRREGRVYAGGFTFQELAFAKQARLQKLLKRNFQKRFARIDPLYRQRDAPKPEPQRTRGGPGLRKYAATPAWVSID